MRDGERGVMRSDGHIHRAAEPSAKPSQAKPSQAKPSQAKASQAKASRTYIFILPHHQRLESPAHEINGRYLATKHHTQ